MNVAAMAILAISGKRDVVDVFILWLQRSGLKRALSQATFSCGEHDDWRSGAQDRSASFRNPVLRKDWLIAENPAHRRATSLRNQRFELFRGDRCGQERRVPNRGDQAPLSRIWKRHPAFRRWELLARRKITEMDELIARAKKMKRLLENADRCKCLDLEDCGKAFRARH